MAYKALPASICVFLILIMTIAEGYEVFDVIVVGGGLAGLAAASASQAAGLRVALLEARNRTGGRVHAVDTPAGAIDTGAMWVHGAGEGNPLSRLAAAAGVRASRPVDYNSGAVFAADGSGRRTGLAGYARVLRAWQAPDGPEAAVRSLRQQAATAAAAASNATPASNAPITGQQEDPAVLPPPPPPPADRALSDVYADWLASARFTPEQRRQAALLMHTRWQLLLNANASALSALRYGDGKTIPAIDVLLSGGMGQLADALARNVSGIRLSTVVTRIEQRRQPAGDGSGDGSDSGDGDDVVVVTTAGGARVAARYAIVTLPLGVLKARSVEFDPPLPERKRRAIDEMGCGLLNKVILVWGDNNATAAATADNVAAVAANASSAAARWPRSAHFVAREPSGASARFCVFLNYYPLLDRAPALVALNAANAAADIEALSDDDTIAEALAALRGARAGSGAGGTGSGVPPPAFAHVTRWAADPYAKGSYSYYAVGNPLNISAELAAPHGRVLFAGEAASPHIGTAHGAYESGLAAAAAVLARVGAVPRV